MGEINTLLYACCPKCSRPIGRAKRCDGMELTCPKCNSHLRLTVDQDAKVSVELVQTVLGKPAKSNINSATPRGAGLG